MKQASKLAAKNYRHKHSIVVWQMSIVTRKPASFIERPEQFTAGADHPTDSIESIQL